MTTRQNPYDDTLRCWFCESIHHSDEACPLKKQAAQEFTRGLAAACAPVEAAIAAMEKPRKRYGA